MATNMNIKIVYHRLRNLRIKYNEGLHEQSQKLGIRPVTISAIERGKIQPPEGLDEKIKNCYPEELTHDQD